MPLHRTLVAAMTLLVASLPGSFSIGLDHPAGAASRARACAAEGPPAPAEATPHDEAPPDEESDLPGEAAAPRTWALLINGGGSAAKSYLSHLHHLQDMVAALEGRGIPRERIVVFSADGEDPGKDLTARSVEPPDFWLIDDTWVGRGLNPPELINTVWDGVPLRPARRSELRKWFAGASEALSPGDTLLVFVTDHGNRNSDDPDNGLIVLWNESLSVLEFRALLGYLQPGVRVVSVMSQCYSGAFAESMLPLHGRVPAGDVCGFYSTTGDREAYGCYPEGRDRDRIGYAFRFIDAMDRHGSLDDVQTSVLVTDTTPDVPVKTSDLYAERFLTEQAARYRTTLEELADDLLQAAWKDRAAWEPDIRLLDRIGSVYGTFSPRSLAELKPRIESLNALADDLNTYQQRWKLALGDLRGENLHLFIEQYPDWKARLDQRNLNLLEAPARKVVLPELLEALKEFTSARPAVWARMQELNETYQAASEAQYRVEIRLAALLRMRAILIRIAGAELLKGTNGATTAGAGESAGLDGGRSAVPPGAKKARQFAADLPRGRGEGRRSGSSRLDEIRRGLAALVTCEREPIASFDPGRERPVASEAPVPLAPFEDDLAAVDKALPSWLGVRFRPVAEGQLEKRDLARGTVLVDQVYPETPAEAAGIAPGDFIVGPPGAHFSEPNQLREWTMTSPRDTPLELDIVRDGSPMKVTVRLAPLPSKLPDLPAPPQAGDEAPSLAGLEIVRLRARGAPGAEALPAPAQRDGERRTDPAAPGGTPAPDPASPLAALGRERHMLFFWATWCGPCKSSLPELTAWSRKTGVPVLAISDESRETIGKFLDSWTQPFPGMVASDELRKTTIGYGVSGTPTFVLIDARGRIEWRQVGYSPKEKLGIPGWSWSGPSD